MNYLNKYSGTAAANLDYQGDGKWSLYTMKDNRYRVLSDGDGNINAIDLEGNYNMVQVGNKLPGYNREVKSITKCDGNEFLIECIQ